MRKQVPRTLMTLSLLLLPHIPSSYHSTLAARACHLVIRVLSLKRSLNLSANKYSYYHTPLQQPGLVIRVRGTDSD
jgi:hypothetical protein